MLETGLKILTKCISNRLNHAMARDPILAPTQFAFLPGMNIMDPIRIMEAVYEQARRNHKADATKEVHIAYLDLRAAFDKVEYWAGEAALNRVRVPPKIRALLHNLNTRSERSIITEHGLTDQWELKNGVPQGEILSPFRFLCLMDMLNTWLARRCAGNNPKREQIGFRFEVCKRPRYNQKWTEGNDTTRVHTLIYADDICLIAETAEHLQQLVGLVHEFFSTAGINLSDTKSYYTTNAPNPTPIYITGSMTQGADANLDGEWTPDTTGPSLTHKKPNESIRYLGVNFELNGTWETQKRIVEDTLKFCLERLEYKDMTMTQMRYVMNAVIIPKLKYALSISAIHQAPNATFCDSLDTTIRRFVLDYFRMARNTSTACVHSNLQHWGLGINSLKAKVYETIIHNTVSSLNDWDLSNKWDKKLRELRPEEHDTKQLYTAYREHANIYPQALLGHLDTHMHKSRAVVFPLGRTAKNPTSGLTKDCLTHRLRRIMGCIGYSTDSREHTPPFPTLRSETHRLHTDPHPPETYISRVIPETILSAMHGTISDTGILHMRDILRPDGIHLSTWAQFYLESMAARRERWRHTRGDGEPHLAPKILKAQTPKWWERLQNEVLETEEVLKTSRAVKPAYQDTPRPLKTLDADVFPGTPAREWVCAPTGENQVTYYTPCEGTQFIVDAGPIRAHQYAVPIERGNETNYAYGFVGTQTAMLDIARGTRDNRLAIFYRAPSPDTINDNHQEIIWSEEDHTRIRINNKIHNHLADAAIRWWHHILTAVHGSTPYSSYGYQQPPNLSAENDFTCATDGTLREVKGTRMGGAGGAKWDRTTESSTPVHYMQRHVRSAPSFSSRSAFTSRDPAEMSSTHTETSGLLYATRDPLMCPPGEQITIGIDNQGVLNAQKPTTRVLTAGDLQRKDMKYEKDETTTLLAQHGQITLKKVAAHSGTEHDQVDLVAKQSAGKSCAYPAPRYPELSEKYHFHLYYYDSLVQDDVRGHINKAFNAHCTAGWEALESHGRLHRLAREHDVSLKRCNASRTRSQKWKESITRAAERLITRYVVAGLPTPARRSKWSPANQPTCPLCNHPRADEAHLLTTCTHPTMTELRDELDTNLKDKILAHLPDEATYMGLHKLISHPAALIHPRKLYPYAADFPDLKPGALTPLIHEYLPDAQWYSPMAQNKEAMAVRDPFDHSAPIQSVLTTTFWRYIAFHPHTHEHFPLAPAEYLQRAKDIYDMLAAASEGPQNIESLSWATPQVLLRIIVDEAKVETELFCSALNACPFIPKHRTAPWRRLANGERDPNAPPNPNLPFAAKGGFQEDGLSPEAYTGSVYGNPPYDSVANRASIDLAIIAARRGNFRATYVVPMSEARIKEFEASENKPENAGITTKVLVKFPKHSMPFIPAQYWKGKGPDTAGVYPDEESRIVIAVVESKELDTLQPMDINSLQQRVATWFLKAAPWFFGTDYATTLSDTRIPADTYNIAAESLETRFPQEWEFWSARQPIAINDVYPGGHLDSQHLHKNPFLEISTFPPTLAYSGTLPPSFDLVLKALGCTKSKAPKLITSIRRDLTTYLKEAWCTYISLCANIPAANIPAADILAANIPAANIPPANIPATFIPAANVLATNIPAANIPVTNNPASVIPTANTLAANIPATSIPALPPFPHEGIPPLSRISHALPMMPPRTASSPASPLITQYSGTYPASSTHQQHTTAHTP
jgi:hypothetical protein